ncbi:MAG: transcription termination/antitermination protein NusG [Oscillospiraceae bacterium]|nr:transcription termination/antitermination protein NusG [Oscillospiraceae bacterium]MBR4928348.1 transcription termination/antitermination protein NusG [Oscillospiraceae bacterium]MBR5070979.1 transcription termination/antitermination protein NusG [Oscillospiraceae bacterium]
MAESAKWYVVHTYSGYENKVAQNLEKLVENRRLQDYILEVKIPTEHVVEIKDNKRREFDRELFPGYVLVKMVMTDESWYIVRNANGVTGFVGTTTKPTPLTQAEVDRLGVENVKVNVDYEPGDTIRIQSGSFEGFTGRVEEIDRENSRVKVRVSVFGRETVAELDLEDVAPL